MQKKIILVICAIAALVLCVYCLSAYTEPLYSKQWGLHEKKPRQCIKGLVGKRQNDLNEVIVAIIDTGMNIDHYEIQNSIYTNSAEILNGIDDDMNGYIDDINGWDFSADTPYVNSYEYTSYENNHATAIASILVAEKNFKGAYNINVAYKCTQIY